MWTVAGAVVVGALLLAVAWALGYARGFAVCHERWKLTRGSQHAASPRDFRVDPKALDKFKMTAPFRNEMIRATTADIERDKPAPGEWRRGMPNLPKPPLRESLTEPRD